LSDAGSATDVLAKRKENCVSFGSLQEDELMPVKKMIKVEKGAEVKVEYDDSDEWSDCSEQNDGDGSSRYEGSLEVDDWSADEKTVKIESEAGEKMLEVKARQDPVRSQEKADEKILCKGKVKNNFKRNHSKKYKERAKQTSKVWYEKNRERAKQTSKEWYEKNKERAKQTSKEWREKNREKHAQCVKAWREKNKEKVGQYSKTWREKNKVKVGQYFKIWREKNKEKVGQYSKIWREKNKENFNEYQRIYRLNNLEKVREYERNRYQRQKERPAKIPGSHSFDRKPPTDVSDPQPSKTNPRDSNSLTQHSSLQPTQNSAKSIS
jgi:hypothetical protein